MKRKFLLLTLLLLTAIAAHSFDYTSRYHPNLSLKKTERTLKFDPERITYGGNFGATFGTLTYVDISPFIGYRMTDEWMAGVGVSYIYYRQRYSPSLVYETHLYGGRLFTQYLILPNVFLHGELEAMNFDYYDYLSGTNSRSWYLTPLLGAGYSQPLGGRSSIRITALYAFNSNNPKSPYYGNPLIFRIGIFI